MVNAEVGQRLQNALRKVRTNLTKVRNRKENLGEEATKKAFIEPVLQGLGWDVSDPFEVRLEYKGDPKGNPVDYALLDNGTPVMFIEAKALDANLDDVKWQGQVAAYAAVAGVKWCILTDGDVYAIYNLFAPGDIREKLFRSITISDEADREEVLTVLQLLAREVFPERLDECWQTHWVDQRVSQALRDMFADKDTKLVNAIRARVKDLKPAEIRGALERAEVQIAFPALNAAGEEQVPGDEDKDPQEAEWGPLSYRKPLRLDGHTVLLRKWRRHKRELVEERVSMDQIRKTAEAALAIQGKGGLICNAAIRDQQEGVHSWDGTQRALAVLYLTGSLECVRKSPQRFQPVEGLTVEAMLQRVVEQAEVVTRPSETK
ncbi:MAG: type I restriction enzyme HsdR N-terminal domain-containing protein [Armatimonadetes bacterium]|nr:type I restriction enzyme HsdR N-terminal domain-containing protein [Armatimonadota bacterium]